MSFDGLIKNKDGSIDLYYGPKSPGKDKESNWLPAEENYNSHWDYYAICVVSDAVYTKRLGSCEKIMNIHKNKE